MDIALRVVCILLETSLGTPSPYDADDPTLDDGEEMPLENPDPTLDDGEENPGVDMLKALARVAMDVDPGSKITTLRVGDLVYVKRWAAAFHRTVYSYLKLYEVFINRKGRYSLRNLNSSLYGRRGYGTGSIPGLEPFRFPDTPKGYSFGHFSPKYSTIKRTLDI